MRCLISLVMCGMIWTVLPLSLIHIFIVSYWGSLGAREMNKKIAQFFACEAADGLPFRHIHACGSFGWRWMPEYVKAQGVELAGQDKIELREFIYDMPQVMAAADLVICRAGAATIAEVAASGTPCIMVPSPNVTEDVYKRQYQEINHHKRHLDEREVVAEHLERQK